MQTANEKPFVATSRGAYWVVIDTRTNGLASYPTTKKQAAFEAGIMNEAYAKALSEPA